MIANISSDTHLANNMREFFFISLVGLLLIQNIILKEVEILDLIIFEEVEGGTRVLLDCS